MTSTQKALLLDKKFGDFVIRDIERYKPGPGEILIKIQAAALNPVDWKIQKYGVFIDTFPAVLGTDVAGDVEEVGEGVTEFKKGDRVFGQGQFVSKTNGFQQYAIALASTTARIPPNLSYDQVASLPVALSAAYCGLYNSNPHGAGFTPPTSSSALGKYAGTPIVVLGGGSSVGQFAIQLANISGFSPIIATASLKHTDFLKSLGATHVFDRNLPLASLKAEVDKLITNQPLKVVFDAISIETTQTLGLGLLAPGGQLITVLPPAATPSEDKTIVPVIAALRLPFNIEPLETFYHDTVTRFLERGLIKPNRVEVLPNGLAGILDGLKRMEADQISGVKLIAHPQETA